YRGDGPLQADAAAVGISRWSRTQSGTGLERDRARDVAHPQSNPAIAIGRAGDRERTHVEERLERAEREFRDRRVRHIAPDEIGKERRDQRRVDDEAGVSLLLSRISAIVVNAVAVERQRRV